MQSCVAYRDSRHLKYTRSCILSLLGLALTPALELAAADHPRVLITPAVVTALKSKQAAGDPDWLELKTQADRYLASTVAPYERNGCAANRICYAYQGHGWLRAVQVLGVAYLVTGSGAYADHVIAILDAANAPFKTSGSLEPLSLDRGYPSRSSALALALAFDWVYDKLDATRKADTINTLNAWFDWYKTPGNAGDAAGPAYGNYFGGHLLGFGAAGYATAGDNPRAEEIQQHMLQVFNGVVPAAFATGGFAGGYAPESYSYGSSQFAYLLQYMRMVNEVAGRDLGLSSYASRIARALIYNLKPNRWQTTDEGDYAGDYTGILPGFLPLLLSSVLRGTLEGAWMQWLYTHLAPPPGSGNRVQTPDLYWRLLYRDAAAQVLDYRTTEPTFYRSAGDEHVFARSDWTDGAVWASFAASARIWTGHEAKKAGHIALQRGNDYLLVNSGQWKGATGVGGSPQAFNRSSWRANTLFADDLGEYMYSGGAYVGGQGIWGSNLILSFDAGSHYVYSKSDLTTAYQRRPGQENPEARAVQSFIRSFVFLGDKYLVVWDRISMLKPSYQKKLFWHVNPTGGLPRVNGTLADSVIGDSRLFIKTLLPEAPAIYAAADGLRNITDSTPVTYRVEVSDSTTGTELNALHVIEATAASDSFPDTTLLDVTVGNMVGALIADAVPRIVLFSREGPPVSSVAYRADYSAGARHLIVDLAPGAYSVRRDGEELFRLRSTTPSGVLEFEAAGGGEFTLIRQSAIGGTIAKAAGDGQLGQPGSVLPEPLIVRVADGYDRPLSGVAVNFSLLEGRASLSATTVETDANGFASIVVALYSTPGSVVVQASNLAVSEQPALFSLASVEGGAGPRISGVVNADTLAHNITAGSTVALFGANLSSTVGAAESLPLPTFLAGVSVQAGGVAAPLFYVSPSRVNFQLPWDLAAMPQVTITVTADGVSSAPQAVHLVPLSPWLFSINSNGSGQGAILIAQTGEVAAPQGSFPGLATRPARRGEFISVYCSGLGSVSNAPVPGAPAGSDPVSATSAVPTLQIGGVPAPVTSGFFSGLAPGFFGLYQINVQVPDGVPSGDTVPVVVTVDGTTSNTVTIAVR